MSNKKEITEYFTKMYDPTKSTSETVCGPGSKKSNNIEFLKFLDKTIKENNINSILDIGCGDMNYISPYLCKNKNIKYCGIDISTKIIEHNNKNFSDLGIFKYMDVINDDLPKNYDLIIVKEVFIHLSDANIHKALSNIKNSESKYLLISGHNSTWVFKESHINNIGCGMRKFEVKNSLSKVFDNIECKDVFTDCNNIRQFNFYKTSA